MKMPEICEFCKYYDPDYSISTVTKDIKYCTYYSQDFTKEQTIEPGLCQYSLEDNN